MNDRETRIDAAIGTADPRGVLRGRIRAALSALALGLVTCPTVFAGSANFAGAFTGQEPTTAAFPGACPGSGPLSWQATAPFRVGTAGDYAFGDAGELAAVDVQLAVHRGAFTPGNPASGRLALLDGGGMVALEAGTDYTLVVQRQCAGAPGAWAVSIDGPGAVNGADAQSAPAWSFGALGNGAPQADFGDGQERYRVAGVLSVPQSGYYTVVDTGLYNGLDVEARLYRGTFNAANPSTNFVATADDAAATWLASGTDYRVVVTGFQAGDTGDYRLVLLPPGEMIINSGLSGAWYEPATSGQGVLVEVYPDRRLVFAAWFTFDVSAPFDPDEATLGDASQRWLTAAGVYEPGAASVSLAVSNTTGGRFDQQAAGQDQDNDYGSLELHFHDCATATLDYDLPSPAVAGSIPLSRVANDNVRTCGAQLPGPGVVSQ